jgi:hypothetical protein
MLLNQIKPPQALLTLDTPLITGNSVVPILPPNMQFENVSNQDMSQLSLLQSYTPQATINNANDNVITTISSEILLEENIPIETEVMVGGLNIDNYIKQAINESVQQCTGADINLCDTPATHPMVEVVVTRDTEDTEGEEATTVEQDDNPQAAINPCDTPAPHPMVEAVVTRDTEDTEGEEATTVEQDDNPQEEVDDSPNDMPENPLPENNMLITQDNSNSNITPSTISANMDSDTPLIKLDTTRKTSTNSANVDSDTPPINLDTAKENPEENDSVMSDIEDTGEQASLEPEPTDNNAKIPKETLVCTQKGYKVCVYDFNQLPTAGRMYKVDKEHNMVAFKFPPGQVYQVDKDGFLISIGIYRY